MTGYINIYSKHQRPRQSLVYQPLKLQLLNSSTLWTDWHQWQHVESILKHEWFFSVNSVWQQATCINEEPIHSKCSPVVMGSRRNGNYLSESMWGNNWSKQSENKHLRDRHKSKAKCRVTSRTLLCACYVKHDKTSTFYSYNCTSAVLRPGTVSESCETNHCEATNKCAVKSLNLMCI